MSTATVDRAAVAAEGQDDNSPHVYILSVRQIADLQVVYPLVFERGVLKNDWS